MTVDSSKQAGIGKDVVKLKRTHKISKLIQLVDKATRNFVAVGEQIANENPEFQVSNSIIYTCSRIRKVPGIKQVHAVKKLSLNDTW